MVYKNQKWNLPRAMSCSLGPPVAERPCWQKRWHACSMYLLQSQMQRHWLKPVMWERMLKILSRNCCRNVITMLIRHKQASFILMKLTKFHASLITHPLQGTSPGKVYSRLYWSWSKAQLLRFHLRVDVNIHNRNSCRLIQAIFCLFVVVPLPVWTRLFVSVLKRAVSVFQRK